MNLMNTVSIYTKATTIYAVWMFLSEIIYLIFFIKCYRLLSKSSMANTTSQYERLSLHFSKIKQKPGIAIDVL